MNGALAVKLGAEILSAFSMRSRYHFLIMYNANLCELQHVLWMMRLVLIDPDLEHVLGNVG